MQRHESKEKKSGEEQKTEFKSVSVSEAKASKAYWNAMGYRHERLAKFQLIGFRVVLSFINQLDIPTTAVMLRKRIANYLLSTWLFSTNDQFKSEAFSPQSVYSDLSRMIGNNTVKNFNLEKLSTLYAHFEKIRTKWNKDINSTRLTQFFTREPTSEDYKEYAAKIQSSAWSKLDYTGKHFLRHLAKALRHDLITVNDLMTAQILYGAHLRFENPIQTHFYPDDEKLFNITEFIPYAKEAHLSEFKKELKGEPKSQRCFFTVDVPHQQMIDYLKQSLNNQKLTALQHYHQLFCKVFGAYIARLKLQHPKYNFTSIDSAFAFLETKGFNSGSSDVGYKNAVATLNKCIYTFEEKAVAVSSEKEKQLSQTLYAMLVGIEAAECVIYMNVNSKDDQRPLLSMIIPSMDFLDKLNTFLYQEAIKPFLIVGKITTRKMRQVNAKGRHRAVSGYHPDIKNEMQAHGYTFDYYTFLWHDVIFSLYKREQ